MVNYDSRLDHYRFAVSIKPIVLEPAKSEISPTAVAANAKTVQLFRPMNARSRCHIDYLGGFPRNRGSRDASIRVEQCIGRNLRRYLDNKIRRKRGGKDKHRR